MTGSMAVGMGVRMAVASFRRRLGIGRSVLGRRRLRLGRLVGLGSRIDGLVGIGSWRRNVIIDRGVFGRIVEGLAAVRRDPSRADVASSAVGGLGSSEERHDRQQEEQRALLHGDPPPWGARTPVFAGPTLPAAAGPSRGREAGSTRRCQTPACRQIVSDTGVPTNRV